MFNSPFFSKEDLFLSDGIKSPLPSICESKEILSNSAGQHPTLKQIDTELKALRRENFDLKWRLFESDKKKVKNNGETPGKYMICHTLSQK